MQGGDFINLPDGRRLEYRVFGAAAGAPVVALHGTPGAGLKFAGAGAVAQQYGLKLICPDRWGYGGSEAPAGARLEDFAEDIAVLADRLGLRRFGLLGVSGGGPFAICCAARLGARVARLALAGPVGDVSRRDGFSLMHKLCFGVFAGRAGLVRTGFRFYRVLLRRAPKVALRMAVGGSAASDIAVIRDEAVGMRLVETFRFGLDHGVEGTVVDMAIFGRGLGGLEDEVDVPCRIWVGSLDCNVPMAGVTRLAQRIAGATLSVRDGDGHFWIARDYDDVLGWLAEGAGD